MLDVASRSIVAGKRIVLLHVNGLPCVETQATSVAHQGGSFRIDGLSIGPLSRDGVADDAPRMHLRWDPAVVPALAVGDELAVAEYGWYHSYVSGRYLGVDRPKPDTAAAPTLPPPNRPTAAEARALPAHGSTPWPERAQSAGSFVSRARLTT